MARYLIFSLFGLLIAGGCATGPRQELQAARMAVAQARHAGAPEWAAEEFSRAQEFLARGEDLIRRGDYSAAQELLPRAEVQARTARDLARDAKAEAERRRQAAAAEKAAAEAARAETVDRAKAVQPPPPPPPPKPKAAAEPPPPPLLTAYQVEQSETLWTIAARRRVYGDPLLWPLLYQANRDQIKDPRQIYPGQIITIPRNVGDREQQEAREKARQSEIFPVEQLLRGAPASPSP